MRHHLHLGIILWLISSPVDLQAENRMAQLLTAAGIQENDAARYALRHELVTPIRDVHEGTYGYPAFSGENDGRFRIHLTKSAVYYYFINRTAVGFPENGKGNFLIRRNRSTGRFEFIQVFYRDYHKEEGDCSLLIRPQGTEARLSITLFGRNMYQDLLLPASLEKLLTAPLAAILDFTRGTVDWRRLLYGESRTEDRRMEEVVDVINAELPKIRTAADGAIDRNGRFVTIADGAPQSGAKGFNCAGFAKWIIDGFYYPLTGAFLDIEFLKTRRQESRGTRWSALREIERDTYFGLDWTRHLAVSLEESRTGTSLGPESRDVRRVPFYEYTEDRGYRLADLYHLLFFLAVDEPGTAYLGAVNEISAGHPVLSAYYHVAVFFPYFDKNGRFRVIVMDQHKDQNIFRFIKRYPNAFIHLVRFYSGGEFSPPHIE